MKKEAFVAVCVFILIFTGYSFSTTYYVDDARPDDTGSGLNWSEAKKTISAAVNSSIAGDTILVRYGTYLLHNSILVTSDRMITSDDGTNITWDMAVYDSSACVLSGDTTRIFTILSSAVSNLTHIRGFKITNGNATLDTIETEYGGGIFVADSADPVIENCWISENIATTDFNGGGGGIAIIGYDTEPIIQFCVIDSNLATSGHHGQGGGIYINDANLPLIQNNKIYYNRASIAGTASGGGIYCENTNAEISSNDIQFNVGSHYGATAGGRGGGIYVFGGDIEIHSNIINNNIAANARSGWGGGIYINALAGNIHDNDISYNIASTTEEGHGGGMDIAGDGVITTFNTITYNIACTNNSGSTYWDRGYGGGAMVDGTFQNNTVSHNTASVHGIGRGGGIYFGTGNYISHNIISHNVASENDEGYGGGGWAYNSANSTMTNNVFYSNANQLNSVGVGVGSGFYYWYGGYNFIFKNNIFSNHNLAGSDSIAVYFDIAFNIYNNCFYENGLDYNANVTSYGEVLGNPQFDDAASGSFEILYNSPCIDAGADTLVYDEIENHDMGWVVDIGAHEYMGDMVFRNINGAGEYYFGGQVRAKINVSSAGSLSGINIKVHSDELHPQMTSSSVRRWFEIIPTGSGATFDVTLSYKDTELNSENEYELNLWRYDGSDWYGPGLASDTSTFENWLTVTGQTEFSDWVISDDDSIVTNLEIEKSQLVNRFNLYQNYPNPFNPVTTIKYSIPKSSKVTLELFDLQGRKIKTLINEQQNAGNHTCQLAADNLASGVYIYRIRAGQFNAKKKLILMK